MKIYIATDESNPNGMGVYHMAEQNLCDFDFI
jgi:hypothetical protein